MVWSDLLSFCRRSSTFSCSNCPRSIAAGGEQFLLPVEEYRGILMILLLLLCRRQRRRRRLSVAQRGQELQQQWTHHRHFKNTEYQIRGARGRKRRRG